MIKPLQKIVLLLSLGLFMTSCFATKQSCGLAQTHKTPKKEPVTMLKSEVIILKEVSGLDS